METLRPPPSPACGPFQPRGLALVLQPEGPRRGLQQPRAARDPSGSMAAPSQVPANHLVSWSEDSSINNAAQARAHGSPCSPRPLC